MYRKYDKPHSKINIFKDRYLRFINNNKTYALKYYIHDENSNYLADSDLMLIALDFNLKLTIELIDNKLLNDVNFLYMAYYRNGIKFVEYLPINIRSNIKLMISLYRKSKDQRIFNSIPNEMKSDINFMLKWIPIEPKIFTYANQQIQNNKIILATISYYTNNKKQLDEQIITKIIINDPLCYKYINKTIITKKYLEYVLNDLSIYNIRCSFSLYNNRLDDNCINIILGYVGSYKLKNEISFSSLSIVISHLYPIFNISLF